MPYFQVLNCCGVKEIAVLQEMLEYPGKTNAEKVKAMFTNLFGPGFVIMGRFKTVDGKSKMVYDKEPSLTLQGGHFFYEDAHDRNRRYGKILTKFILKNKLGTVIATKQAPNPNYIRYPNKGKLNQYHMITAYVWTPDVGALLEWCKKNMTPTNIRI